MEILTFIIDNIASLVNMILAVVVMFLLKTNDCLECRIESLEYAVNYLLKKEDENDEQDI